MNKQIRRVLVLLVAPWALLALYACIPEGGDANGINVTISVNSWPGFGPLYIAESQGLFEDRGLDVEVVLLEGGAERRAGLISGRLDILGASLDDFAVTVDRGADAIAVGCADFSNGADGIVVGGPVQTLKELTEADVAVEPGLPNHFFLLYVLDKNGLSIPAENILPMTPDDAGAAFISGQIDAAVTWEPHISRAVRERDDARVLVRSSEYPEAILDLFIARRAWLADNREVAEKFRSAWDDAVAFLRSEPESGISILAERLAIDPGELAGILEGIRILKTDECVGLIAPQLPELSQRVERIWSDAGYLDEDPSLATRFWFER